MTTIVSKNVGEEGIRSNHRFVMPMYIVNRKRRRIGLSNLGASDNVGGMASNDGKSCTANLFFRNTTQKV